MKKILVPTDFSPIADNAMQYAFEIATRFNSELYLYHAYAFDRFNYDLNFSDDEQPYAKKVEQKMKRKKQRLKECITQNDLHIKAITEKGSILWLFQGKVKEYGINLIVMGTKGATGMEKVIFGSVAAAALEMAEVPVLAIPPNYTFNALKHIVLAIDHKGNIGSVLIPLKELALKFKARITLLNINTDSDERTYHEISSSGLEDVETTYQSVSMSKNVNESINEFISKERCDLLCMVKRKKGFFESLFKKSTTKTQVYNSLVPLLVLPE